MSSGDAWLFPIVSTCVRRAGMDGDRSSDAHVAFSPFCQVGSVVLFGMYVVVTYVGKEWINWLLGWYFSVAGAGSVWRVRRSFFFFSADAFHSAVTNVFVLTHVRFWRFGV